MGLAFAMGNDGRVSDPQDEAFLALSERPPTRKAGVMAATGLLSSLLIAALTVLPSPYAIEEAGPTYDTLAIHSGTPVVGIEGAPSYDSTGELRLTTVAVSRAGNRPFTVGRVIESFISPHRTVLPEELVFGTPTQEKQEAQQSQEAWITSQESATVSALEARGTVVPAALTIASILDESNAKPLLEIGDVIVAADGEEFVSYSDLIDNLGKRKPGDTITLTVIRAGQTRDETFDLIANEDGGALMGVSIDPTFDLPVKVTVGIDAVSGPSAGLMFALAIMDKLSPQDELGGAKVAGTGTIDVDGTVGPIGGIQHKLDGARAAGADYFLAPSDNCSEVVGHIPQGLSVYAVTDLADAYAAIEAIGKGKTDDLPTCTTASTTKDRQ